jgi:hypothetical protein
MRTLFFSVVMVLACAFVAGAGDKTAVQTWGCYQPGVDGKVEVFKTEAQALEIFNGQLPYTEYLSPKLPKAPKAPKDPNAPEAPGGPDFVQPKPWRVSWGKFPGEEVATQELVTNYKGHDVFLFLYKHRRHEGEEDRKFDFAVLAYEVGGNRPDKVFRPFFVLPGRDVREFEVAPLATDEHPNGIEITRKYDGEGGFTTVWVVEFEKGGPRLVEWRETGGKKPDVTYHYAKGVAISSVEKGGE